MATEIPPKQLMDRFVAADRDLREGLGLPDDTWLCDVRDCREAYWMLDRNTWKVIWADSPLSREVFESPGLYSSRTVSDPIRTGGLAAIVVPDSFNPTNEILIFDELRECTDTKTLKIYYYEY